MVGVVVGVVVGGVVVGVVVGGGMVVNFSKSANAKEKMIVNYKQAHAK